MPRGDGTGPIGAGPMTGRGAGYCAGGQATGYGNKAFGRRSPYPQEGRGKAGAFGWRNRVYPTGAAAYGAPLTREAEIEGLKAEAVRLEEMMKTINERLTKLSEEK